jgi:hypothetical protein
MLVESSVKLITRINLYASPGDPCWQLVILNFSDSPEDRVETVELLQTLP